MQAIKLLHLKIACYLYNQFSNYDKSYLKLANEYSVLDLSERNQTRALIKWLRNWGCRQFKESDEELSIKSIMDWYISIKQEIQNINESIIEYDLEHNKKLIIEIFDKLATSKAARRQASGHESDVRIGPVGTAKILFALRPNLYAPWDTPIYNTLELAGNGLGYFSYLKNVQEALRSIKKDVENSGIIWDKLFKYLDKKHNSYPKLIDEYYWIKITQGCDPSEIEKIFTKV